jgi:hypothetical protein
MRHAGQTSSRASPISDEASKSHTHHRLVAAACLCRCLDLGVDVVLIYSILRNTVATTEILPPEQNQ